MTANRADKLSETPQPYYHRISISCETANMEGIIKDTSDYKRLLSYRKTDVIYQITYYFCHSYLAKGDRTVDQMVQAARRQKRGY